MTDKTNTPDELLDLVNENDQIIGEIYKKDANQNPKFIHREVAVIIYDNKNRILFQQRSHKKKVNPGIWAETCAGHVPKGMKPQDAAHMELKEEMGFDTKLTFYVKTLARPKNETHFTYWYTGKFPPQTQIKIEVEEVEQAKFVSKKEFADFIKAGGKYNPLKWGGQPEDIVKKFWSGKFKS